MVCNVGVGGGGFIGIALEDVAGTYKAPTFFFPIDSEDLAYTQETVWRTPIRQTVDKIGAVPGNARVEGSVGMDAMPNVIPYFLAIGRTSYTFATGVYTFLPTSDACPAQTASITVVRNNQVFGYTGVVTTDFSFSIEDGILKANFTLLGLDEKTQPMPTPDFSTDVGPYGAGQYKLEIPTSTQVYDVDSFEFSVTDNGEAQYRLKDTGQGASFVSYGEREVTATTTRDFTNRDEYEKFKLLTQQSLTLMAFRDVLTDFIELNMTAAIVSEYTVGLSGQGDLIMADCNYMGIATPTAQAYSIRIGTTNDISVP
jgi:tail tube protein